MTHSLLEECNQTCNALKHYTKNISLPSTLCHTEIFLETFFKTMTHIPTQFIRSIGSDCF